MTLDNAPPSKRAKTAAMIVRITSLWVVAGALFKLFAGSPNDLPASVFDYSPLGPVDTFRVAIGLELSIVILALLRPALAWLPLVLLFAVFDLVLLPLVQAGEASCGCFGSSVSIPPAVMMAIDSACLLAILAMRPWSAFATRSWKIVPLLPLFVLAFAAPWYKFKTATFEPKGRPDGAIAVVDSTGAGEDGLATVPDGADQTPDPNATWVWSLPDPLPDFHWFETSEWEGQTVYDIDLYTFLDVDFVPPDAHVIFYRQTCDHCQSHLEQMAMEPMMENPVVLVRVIELGDTPENNIIMMKPEGVIDLELPALERGYGITTPMSLDIEGSVVTTVTNLREE